MPFAHHRSRAGPGRCRGAAGLRDAGQWIEGGWAARLIKSDDAEGWERVQRGASAAPTMPILVNRGLNREVTSPEGWPTSHVTDESGMREAYSMYRRLEP